MMPTATTRPTRLSVRRLLAGVAATVLLAACSGQRPELVIDSASSTTVAGDQSATTVPANDESTASTSTGDTDAEDQPVVAPNLEDCVVAIGPGPWQVVIDGATPPATPCVAVASHHTIDFVNTTPESVAFDLAGISVAIDPSTNFVTEPAGTFLQPDLTLLNATPHPVAGVWLRDPGQNTLAGQLIGLSSFGPLAIGASFDGASASIDAGLNPGQGSCYITSIQGDPYSPLLTVVDGTVAVIRVFTPGQLTRSEIGIGSTEDDVRAAYGEQIESLPSPDGNAERTLLVFVPNDEADQQYRLAFTVENGTVVSIRNGLTDAVLNTPGCPA
jgi:hypothetical protein